MELFLLQKASNLELQRSEHFCTVSLGDIDILNMNNRLGLNFRPTSLKKLCLRYQLILNGCWIEVILLLPDLLD